MDESGRERISLSCDGAEGSPILEIYDGLGKRGCILGVSNDGLTSLTMFQDSKHPQIALVADPKSGSLLTVSSDGKSPEVVVVSEASGDSHITIQRIGGREKVVAKACRDGRAGVWIQAPSGESLADLSVKK